MNVTWCDMTWRDVTWRDRSVRGKPQNLVSQFLVKMTFFPSILSLVSHVLYWQNFACQFAKISYFLNLVTYMSCILELTAMNDFMLSWTFHFFETQSFVISAMIYILFTFKQILTCFMLCFETQYVLDVQLQQKKNQLEYQLFMHSNW